MMMRAFLLLILLILLLLLLFCSFIEIAPRVCLLLCFAETVIRRS